MNFGKSIKLCRQQKSLKQAELAFKADISTSYLSLIERNERDPTLSTIKAIAGALDVPPSILMFLSADQNDLDSLGADVAEKLSWVTYKLMQEPVSE